MQLNALHVEGMNCGLIFNVCKISGFQSLKLNWKNKTKNYLKKKKKHQQNPNPKENWTIPTFSMEKKHIWRR